jgi:hypothetical protein
MPLQLRDLPAFFFSYCLSFSFLLLEFFVNGLTHPRRRQRYGAR